MAAELIGKTVPNIKYTLCDGTKGSLHELIDSTGKAVVLDLYTSW